ncbi:hypothetical protein [Microbacterium sp. ZW T5_56]|uniref:hypothetical protein n=1 Tax=Microbacterium sp. ZW T5_56 TaxID=3378081 RepID=UPI0038551F3E
MRTFLATATAALVLALCGCTPGPTVEVAVPEASAVATPIPTQPPAVDDLVTPALPENAVLIADYAPTDRSLSRTRPREFVGTMGADLMCTGGAPLTFGVLAGSSAEVPCDGKTYRIQHDSNLSVAEGGLEVTAELGTRWAAVVWLYPEG